MHKKIEKTSRRDFLKASAVFGSIMLVPSYVALGNQSKSGISPNEKVNLAVIGIGGQGGNDLKNLYKSGHCNVVAICDVDWGGHTRESREAHPNATQFTDFRKMFDQMANQIDAVLIATPDHSHFAATMLAMSLGKHVFVEKPLAHIYGQSVGGSRYPLWLEAHETVRKSLNMDEWNRVTLLCQGDTVKTWINGIPAAHWINTEFDQGFLSLQIHASKSPGEVHFRNIKLKELSHE